MTRTYALAHHLLRLVAAATIALTTTAVVRPLHAQQGDTAKAQRRDTLESVVIRATRSPAAAPSARHIVTRAELQATNDGQDAPLVLQSTPNITAYSEAGGFSGYSYVRFRGLDQSRLNITVDGVPLNDPEDQVLYFSNVPDLLGSMSTVEVGRGVGASTFGTAPFAGSLNFQSVPLATTARGGQVDLTTGSFGTWRASAQGATGVSTRGLSAYGRFTRQGTNGYRDHSGNDAWSGFGSAAWFAARDALKLTAFAGLSGTRLAYYAAPESALAINRRANPVTDAEGDRFHQEMVSLQYSRTIAAGLTGTLQVYRNSAAGAYDVDFGPLPGGGESYGNYGLAHVWAGATTAFTWTSAAWSLAVGGSASDYHRDHRLALRQTLDTPEYLNTGVKRDAAAFLKATWTSGALRVGADVSHREARFRYDPSSGAGIAPQGVRWSFVNPKLGVSWDDGGPLSYYATAGRSWREPARTDLFAGADDINQTNIDSLLPLSRVRPERVDDYEAGVVWRGGAGSLTVNAFAMEFRNEIAPIGQMALTGAPLRRNVPSSHRRGVELDGHVALPGGDVVRGNLSVMRARIAEYTDAAASTTYRDIEPLLTPPVTANIRWEHALPRRFRLALSGRHVAPMHLANDGNPALVVPAQSMVDGSLAWESGATTVRLDVNNMLDADAFASGYTDGTLRYLYPIATRSLLLTVRREFGAFRASETP